MKYIIILLVAILLIAGCLWLLYKWYIQDQQEQDTRINILEARYNSGRNIDKQVYEALVETINDYHDELVDEIKLIKKQLKKKSDKNE